MPTLRWLHLTDLHWGDKNQRPLWNDNMLHALRADLRALRDEIDGPIDLILFTGDLVFGGTATEFNALGVWLDTLHAAIKDEFGSPPSLLAVPGNHDLVRPPEAAAEALIQGWGDGTAPRVCDKIITEAFAPYRAWWDGMALPRPGLRPGLMPGDFSATIDKDGYKVGIVGLNSAFLHLKGGDLQGKLALVEEQLDEVCDKRVNDWIDRHHVSLLLTHHPRSWLSDPHHFEGEIAPAGRFAEHLCGHMHRPETIDEARGDGPRRRQVQGASIFGLEKVKRGAQEEDRIHGYNIGVLEFNGTTAAVRRLPRRAVRKQDLSWGFGPDPTYHLVDRWTAPQALKMHAAPPSSASSKWRSSAASTPPEPKKLQTAGGRYDPAWYVDRGQDHEALDHLRDSTPFMVLGPAHCGKRTFLERVESLLPGEDFWQGGRVYHVSCDLLRTDSLASMLDDFEQDLCSNSKDDSLFQVLEESRARTTLTRQMQTSRFVERGILHLAKGPVLVVLHKADQIITSPSMRDFTAMLRSWGRRFSPQLRLVLTAATSRYYSAEDRSNWHDGFGSIRLHDFTPEQVEDLARRHDVQATPAALEALRRKVGGHPYMVRFYLYHAAGYGRTLEAVLHDAKLAEELLKKVASWFSAIPDMVKAEISRAYGPDGGPLSPGVREWMRESDLLGEDSRGPRCEMYRALFAHWRGC